MAGIGLNIDHHLRRGTYAATLWAYLTAATVFAGPWILGVLAVFGLRAACASILTRREFDLFLGTVTYVYCFSTILTGLTQLVLVRALSDRLYLGDTKAVVPLYVAANVLNGVLHVIGGCLFWLPQDMPLDQRLCAIAMFAAVGFGWQAIAFMGCLTRYGMVLAAFAAGYGVAIILGAWLGGRLGLTGVLVGFTSGVMLAFAWITGLLFAEFHRRDASLRDYVDIKLYPDLILLGLVYNLALWADRIVFWTFHPGADSAGPYLSYPPYEQAVFLAYLTVVPAQALIMVRVELVFGRRCLAYTAAVVGRAGLTTLRQMRDEIVETLKLSLARVASMQGSCTLLVIVLAPQIVALFAMPAESVYMFRAAAVGSCLHVLLQGAVLIMLYLSLYRLALAACALFLASQVAGALVSLAIGFPAYGFGYVAACLVTLCAVMPVLSWWVRHLDYYTFGLQPV